MALPDITVNPADADRPRQPGVPEPRVFTPQIAELPSPLRSIAAGAEKASDNLNDVAKDFAQQAGHQAVTRDADGNLQVAQAPIVGDAALVFHNAVKQSALWQGEAEAKQKDLLMSKQFHDDPQGYLDAAKAFRDAHVADYTKKFGADVGGALGGSIDNATTYNYRWLVLEQQRQIKQQLNQGSLAKIQSIEEDIHSLIQSDGLNTPEGRKRLQELTAQRVAFGNMRVNNPLIAEAPEVATKNLKDFDLTVGADKFVAGLKTVLNNPAGGMSVARGMVDDTLTDEKLTPNQRVLNHAAGLKAINDYRTDLERQITLGDKAQKIQDQQFEDKVIKDSAAPNPSITENDIKTAPGISPESRMRMLAWQKRDGMPEPLARVSQSNAVDLFRRMNLDDDDPQHISDLRPVRNEYVKGNLSRQDEEWLEKRFVEGRSPDGSKLTQIRAQFSKAVEPSIDKSNPLLGKIDQDGKLQVYRFEQMVQDKVDEYRAAKKNPADLFNSNKPDFLGDDKIIQQYRIPIDQSIKNIGRNLGAGAAPKPQRQPGEGVADFLKRTGGAP